MPILLKSGDVFDRFNNNYHKLLNDKQLMENIQKFKVNAIDEISDAKRLLYVGQREYATVKSDDPFIDIIGSDDSTTCHIGLIVDIENGNCSLSHFDGSDTSYALSQMIESLKKLKRPSAAADSFKLYIIGGFEDERELSIEITTSLIDELNMNKTDSFHLELFMVNQLNDRVDRTGTHFPIAYGLGYRIKTGEVFMCNKFTDHGPDIVCRSARHFTANHTLNIYDTESFKLVIGPFTYTPIKYVNDYLKLPDKYLLKYFSTSPQQEPEHFIGNLRRSFQMMIDHPKPLQTYFVNGKAKVYSKQPDGSWKLDLSH